MARIGMILAAVVMLAAAGTLEVLRSGKRADAATVRRVQDCLNAVSSRPVGDWKGEDVPYDQKLLDRAEAQAHLSRRYRQAFTDETVDVLILAGNPRALGAHDPTVCFAGIGYKQEADEQRRTVSSDANAKQSSFWAARFRTDDIPPAAIELFWAWGTEGDWSAVSNPRLEYANEPLILKIYVSRPLNQFGRSGDRNLTEKFLSEFLPQVREAFHPASP
ncbi:MAG TPA: exosortase-associated EpsI family protein [Fimbriiglobus sp.]